MVDSRKDFINRDKVWMKYYSEEAKNAKLPDCTAYDYVKRLNKDRYDAPALHYYGNDITFGELVDRIEATAQAFCAAGVRPGDIVSFVSVQIPETIASIYALNKIGATANMIDPRMDVTSISRMITNSGSKVLVTLDIAWPKIKQIKTSAVLRSVWPSQYTVDLGKWIISAPSRFLQHKIRFRYVFIYP